MMNRIFHIFFVVIFVLPMALFSTVLGKATSINTPTINEPIEMQVVWLRDGEENHLTIPLFHGKEYIAVEQLASLSQAQTHWQQASDQVCLSRTEGEMCFSWKTHLVTSSKHPAGKKTTMVYKDAKLWLPISFVTTTDFAAFSKSNLTWDGRKKNLIQTSPVTLAIPAVENLGDRYRLTLRVNSDMKYSLLQKDDKRIWLQFNRARTEGSQILEGDGVIHDIRIRQHRNSADLIINLGAQAVSSEVELDNNKTKLVIEVFLTKQAIVRAAPAIEDKSIPVIKPHSAIKQISPVRKITYPSPVADKKIRTIVVDAGHGGVDCGALGVRGTMEKDINLRVAKALVEFLSKEPNTRVLLTRNRDEFISLDQRTQIANSAKADIFVSIHCNSSLSSKSRGFEAYILSPDATDEAAASVARIENSVIQIEAKEQAKPSKVSDLLASMAVANFINESTKMANLICRNVRQKASSVHSTSIREANFFVLRGALMPGVLVELDYLSNPISESRLRSSRFTSQLAKGIADGVLFYDRSTRVKISSSAPVQKRAQQMADKKTK